MKKKDFRCKAMVANRAHMRLVKPCIACMDECNLCRFMLWCNGPQSLVVHAGRPVFAGLKQCDLDRQNVCVCVYV